MVEKRRKHHELAVMKRSSNQELVGDGGIVVSIGERRGRRWGGRWGGRGDSALRHREAGEPHLFARFFATLKKNFTLFGESDSWGSGGWGRGQASCLGKGLTFPVLQSRLD